MFFEILMGSNESKHGDTIDMLSIALSSREVIKNKEYRIDMMIKGRM